MFQISRRGSDAQCGALLRPLTSDRSLECKKVRVQSPSDEPGDLISISKTSITKTHLKITTPNWMPGESYRRLSVSVGQNPVNLHFFLVHMVDVYPQVPARRVCRAVCFGRVVVVVRVLLQGGTRQMEWGSFYCQMKPSACPKSMTSAVFLCLQIGVPVFFRCIAFTLNSVNNLIKTRQ